MSSTRLAEWGVVAFHRGYAEVGGGPLEGLFLSQGVYWQGRADDPDGWFYKTQEAWEIEAHLSRRNLGTVRDKLKKRGLLEEKLRGIPAKMHYRINIEKLEQLVADLPKPPKPGDRNKKKKEEETRANKFVRNEQTGMTETSKQDCSKAPNITKTTQRLSETTTTTPDPLLHDDPEPEEVSPTPPPAAPEKIRSSSRDDERKDENGEGEHSKSTEAPDAPHCPLLYFPRAMPREERPRAYEIVAPHNGLAQALLDELAGVMDKGKVQTSRLSILYGMAKNAAAGNFTPSHGPGIAARREQWLAARKQPPKPDPPATPPPQAGGPPPPKHRNRPEGLRQLKGVLNKRTLQNHHPEESP